MATNKEKEKDAQIVNPFWEHLGIMQCSLKEAKKVAKLCFDCGHVPVFIAEAGVGKSQTARQIAEELGWNPVFKFLAHLEPEDLGGIPYPDKEGNTYRFLCEESMRNVMLSDQPTLLVLDEWNRGEKSVMNAAFTLMEDRLFGSHKLPDHVKIMACMNPSEGNYLVNEAEKDPAFRRRLCFIGVRTDAAIFLEYATGPGKFHPLVTGYIQASQNSLTDVNARESGKIYANPASWEKVSQTLQVLEKSDVDFWKNETTLRYKLGGHLGSGMAQQFIEWAKENTMLINPEDILNKYKAVRSRVTQLVKQGRNDTLSEVSESVALTLLTQELVPDKIAKNLGSFSQDLPEDMAMSFFQKLAKHAQTLSKPEYFVKLSAALSGIEAYRKTLQSIHKSQDKVEDEAKKSEDKDNDSEDSNSQDDSGS